MKVLLQKSVANLGPTGELVNVKPGYARNFLIPNGLAVVANEKNKKHFTHVKRITEFNKKKELESAQSFAKTLSSLSLTISKAVGEGEKIFGSVTTLELAHEFAKLGHKIEKKNITVKDDIKRVGVYKGSVKVHPEVDAEFNIWVVAQNSEKEAETAQAQEAKSE